jgi:hypothetical protein
MTSQRWSLQTLRLRWVRSLRLYLTNELVNMEI